MDWTAEASRHCSAEGYLMLDSAFEIAAGSVSGRDHRSSLRNNHDAFYWEAHPGVLVAVVCDGCGSGEHSEVGAKLGARIAVRQVLRWFGTSPKAFAKEKIADHGLPMVARSVLSQIGLLADQMAGSFSQVVSEYFLFTIVGVIVTQEDAIVFGAGDGLIIMNGGVVILGDGKNRPSYLAYGLVETESPIDPEFKVVAYEKQSDLRSILLATDGVRDLINSSEKKIPGKDEKVGSIEQFWTNDAFFKNQFGIQRRLGLINRTVSKADYEKKVIHEEHGHLPDDTTILVIRRRKS